MTQQQPIKAIFGPEPMREGEYPSAYLVGSTCHMNGEKPTVDKIMYREHNYGDHGVGWFDVFSGERCIASMSARSVAEIHYMPEQPA